LSTLVREGNDSTTIRRQSHEADMAPYAERGDDLYETPPCAVRALLSVEKLPYYIWEPACGPGAISRELEAAGHSVHSTDIRHYGYEGQKFTYDFLSGGAYVIPAQCIVTNPPFMHAQAFVERALRHCPFVIMLLRLQFLESNRRSSILDDGRLARIHVFKDRLPRMHRAGWEGPKAGSRLAFAWFVWNRFNSGPATIDRISWRPFA
jgi:hypothetical protein